MDAEENRISQVDPYMKIYQGDKAADEDNPEEVDDNSQLLRDVCDVNERHTL